MQARAKTQRGKQSGIASSDSPRWHGLPVEAAAARLESDLQLGLDRDVARARLEVYGPNDTEHRKPRTVPAIVGSQFSDLMIVILIGAAVIAGFLGEIGDMITIAIIVIINAIVGATQEIRAQRALAALQRLSAINAVAIRNGKPDKIDAEHLVPGDLIALEAGDVVPADVRLIETTEFVTDESALTGESATVEKRTDLLADAKLPVGDRLNMAFKSTHVTKGCARGLVVGTGAQTEVGHIAALLGRSGPRQTPLQQRLQRFSQRLALIVLAICVVIFVAGLLRGEPAGLMFFIAISLAVAAIPESLPAVVTVSLALGARALSHHRSLIRRLAAVESLGSVTYICTDKTGTLTENRMTVARIFAAGREYEALSEPRSPLATMLGTACALCNDVRDESSADPTELALVQAAAGAGHDRQDLLRDQPLLQHFPFDTDRRLMTTLHRAGDTARAWTKGAPEQVLERSAGVLDGDGRTQRDVDRPALQATADALAGEGYRVLAIATKSLPSATAEYDRDEVEADLEFVALVGLLDPIRAEVPQAIEECRTAGISVVMITGDHPNTARHIAAATGILGENGRLLSGQELERLSDAELAAIVSDVRVYARVDPEQKIRIVRTLQDRGEHVAMTGDGVNDAPALRQATIGVAMGKRGTDVARETADLVLLDDNFATIVTAVRGGRRVYDNIRKFIRYTMTSNTGEIMVLLLAALIALPIPLLPIHILWINLVTDGLPGLAFSTERAESDVMRRPPRSPRESVFAHGLWIHMLWIGALLATLALLNSLWIGTEDPARWQTSVFTTLVVTQLLQAIVLRSEKQSIFTFGLLSNGYMAVTVAGSIGLQLLVVYLPFFNRTLHTVPLTAAELLQCFALSAVILPAIELQKWVARRNDSRRALAP